MPLFKWLTTTALDRHIGCEHDFDSSLVRFAALEHVPLHARGGGIDGTLLQLETKWLRSLYVKYPGLKEYISFKSFLQ